MSLARALARIPSSTALGRVVRRLFSLIPRRTVETVRNGPLKGIHWIVASGVNGYWLGTYEPEMQAAIRDTVVGGGVFFDIGAHAGYYSLLASQLVGPGGRVFAFEPDLRNLDFLKQHLQLNSATNVEVIDAAVADVAGAAAFAPERSGFGGALSPTGSVTVRTVAIDTLVDIGALPVPNYLKIDVEGAEFRVICGARKVLRTKGATVFLATHNPTAERMCLHAFESMRYAVRPITRDTWLCLPPART